MYNFWTEEICSMCCRSSVLKKGTVHSVTDIDGCTWYICDDCWKRIKEVMDKEEIK